MKIIILNLLNLKNKASHRPRKALYVEKTNENIKAKSLKEVIIEY